MLAPISPKCFNLLVQTDLCVYIYEGFAIISFHLNFLSLLPTGKIQDVWQKGWSQTLYPECNIPRPKVIGPLVPETKIFFNFFSPNMAWKIFWWSDMTIYLFSGHMLLNTSHVEICSILCIVCFMHVLSIYEIKRICHSTYVFIISYGSFKHF